MPRPQQAPRPVLLMAHNLGFGGTERQLAETAKALDRDRFSPHIGCLRGAGARMPELREAGIPIVSLDVTSFGSASALAGARALGRYIRQHEIQLVHTFDLPMNLFGVPVAWWYRAPVVLSSQRAYRTLTSVPQHRFIRFTDRLVDGIVVNCEAMRTHLVEDGVKEGLIHLCYNGIDTSAFQPEGPRIEDPALDGAAGVIGVICQMRPEKGVETLVEGFARSGAAARNWKLAIVGTGVIVEKLQALANQLGLGNSIIFRPGTTQVAEWLRRIDIFVLPSLSEALSNSIMEAMACGCAVAASRVGGNVELAQDGITGLTFAPGDADELAVRLRSLVEDSGLRRKLASAGNEFIHRNFTLAQAGRTMGAIYDQALAR